MPGERKEHWEQIYRRCPSTALSWYEARPSRSCALIAATGAGPSAPILDVGGGASLLADALLDAGYTDVTVLDVSASALERVRDRLGDRAVSVRLVEGDVTDFVPDRPYSVWHDRAVFHFLTDPAERRRYRSALVRALPAGGHAILATFAPSGPPQCSGLEVVRYSPAALAAELGTGFELIESLSQTHVTPGGREQPFVYCRFRVLGGTARTHDEHRTNEPQRSPPS
jgi:SAM-dependent methyltransferase